MEEKTRYAMDDLVNRTGLSRRTIRFYVERGLIDPPAGRGRGGFYDESHLARLLEIRKSREEGRSLDSIKSIFEPVAAECSALPDPFPVETSTLRSWELAPGLSLQVEETLFESHRSLIQAIISTVQQHEDTGRSFPAREGEKR